MTDNNPIRAAVRKAISRQRYCCGYPDDALAGAAMSAHIKALEENGWTLIPPGRAAVVSVADLPVRRKAVL